MRAALAWLWVVSLLLAAALASPLAAREEILRFESRIEVEPEGAILVEETITVKAEGADIRRGIYRDLPIRYPAGWGLVRRVGFTLLEVRRDGRPEPHFTETIGDHLRIYAGDRSVFLRPGEYTYVFRYRITREVRHFEDFDELYWNVTGNFWTFPIARAVAAVRLPERARIMRHAAYTGRFGEAGKDYAVVVPSGNMIRFETTRTLGPGEGLTIAVAVPKGIIAEPGEGELYLWRLWDNLGVLLLLIGGLATGGFFHAAWYRVGRDPPRGLVIPLFAPPANLSPAAVSYVYHQGFAAVGGSVLRAFIAALMSLAAKRRIRIEDREGTVGLKALRPGPAELPAGEAVIMRHLLGSSDRFDFNVTTGETLKAAQTRFRSAILKEHEDVFFRENKGLFFIGAIISAAALAGFVLLARPSVDHILLLAAVGAVAASGAFLMSMGARLILGWLPGGGPVVLGVLLAFAGSVVLIVLAGALIEFRTALPIIPAAVIVAMALMNVAFFHLLRAPTKAGRKVMDEIEGFRLYLSVAEAEWMNMARDKAPEMSPDLFEAYLPYAVALGVEKPWSDAFQRHMARVMPGSDASAYRPTWYHGDWSSHSLGRAMSGMVSSMSSNMAASMPSSSGSGSGGGGSSGGGGGGGGGGGW